MAKKKPDTEKESDTSFPFETPVSKLYEKYVRYQQEARKKSFLTEQEFTAAFKALDFESAHIVKTDIELGYKIMKELHGKDWALELNGKQPTFADYADQIKAEYAEGSAHLKTLLEKAKKMKKSNTEELEL